MRKHISLILIAFLLLTGCMTGCAGMKPREGIDEGLEIAKASARALTVVAITAFPESLRPILDTSSTLMLLIDDGSIKNWAGIKDVLSPGEEDTRNARLVKYFIGEFENILSIYGGGIALTAEGEEFSRIMNILIREVYQTARIFEVV